ncbi:MAG: T9SS type A sorting domain-containing protein [Melioribacteraceae bacterium]|nr:T9SS type A sorting domain-containing protein [Melioribacteraceae bacterium]
MKISYSIPSSSVIANPTSREKQSQEITSVTSFPRNGNVKLTVYDILGREVTTLVSKEQPAGNYSVKFDASGLTSGLYFYRLITDGFTSTKKMLLLR